MLNEDKENKLEGSKGGSPLLPHIRSSCMDAVVHLPFGRLGIVGRMEVMNILAKKEIGLNEEWQLVSYGDNFYAYGTMRELNSRFGVPVYQRGTKEEIIEHCELGSQLCEDNIKKLNKELERDEHNAEGWKVLISFEKKELEALREFTKVLKLEEQ